MSAKPFQIGLVGAGAISAGAYTGGVVDFLILALDEWHKAKGGRGVPNHEVCLKVFSGASAGGMTAAIAAGFIGTDQPHIADEADAAKFPGRNKLFDSWVESIDIKHLLGLRDLQSDRNSLASLLDSTVLSEIAERAFVPGIGARSYVADDFQVMLTVTNLRGVPYTIALKSGSQAEHKMSLHADYMHFWLVKSPKNSASLPANAYAMTWSQLGTSFPLNKTFKLAALASGAFPIGLAPRILTHDFAQGNTQNIYAQRLWDVPGDPNAMPHACRQKHAIPTRFGELSDNYVYEFKCVDGGVMNNEPFELARQCLAGGGARNPREGEKADAAVILIDPFPSGEEFEVAGSADVDLLATVKSMFGALVNQARFKPDELVLASQDNVYSRFLISPSRGDRKKGAIACGSLKGFGGFLKREFRAHDYFLGRRNAQKFLRDHFCLPETNPLFEGQDIAPEYYVRDASGNLAVYADKDGKPMTKADGSPIRMVPIIPLVGKASPKLHLPDWPSYSDHELAQVMNLIDQRAQAVLHRVADLYLHFNSYLKRGLSVVLVPFLSRKFRRYAETLLRDELIKYGLMRK